MPITLLRSPAALGIVMIAVLTACSTGPEGSQPASDTTGDRIASAPLPPTFYVEPTNPAAEQAARWEAEGRTDDAAQLRKISERPIARWMTGGADVRDEVDTYVGRAAIAGQTPMLVTHYLPERDCGRFGVAGAPTAGAYLNWIRDFAAGIKGRPVMVIVEPNAVADAVDGCVKNVDQRYALLKDAINVLKSTGSARVYLDAGHPQWIKDVEKLAEALDRAGIDLADGFALNVANFVSTADNVRYGHRISDALGGKVPFVIDTSRNGNGPYPGRTAAGAPTWCNPPGRALGVEPTEDPGLDRVDALLWIKYPGESDGPCRPGEPDAGTWWPEYALDLARRPSG